MIEKGILSVAPQGDDYVLTWDLAKAVAAADAPVALKVSPWVNRITPTLDGGRLAHRASLPTLSFGAGGKGESGTLAFDGFRFDAPFDPAAPEFFRAKLALGEVKADVKSRAGAEMQHWVLTQSGGAGELRLRPGGAGAVDARRTQSAAASSEKSSIVGEGGEESPAGETRHGAATAESAVIGLRAAAFCELWRLLVAHADRGPPSGEDLRPKLATLAPLWQELSGRVEVGDVAVAFPGGTLNFKSAGEEVKMSGALAHSSAALALVVKDLTVDLEAAPDWVKTIWPLSLALQIESGFDGLDRATEITLADPELFKPGDLDEDARTAIKQTLAGGHPRVAVSETWFAIPLVKATFAGKARFGETGPEARAKITADDLDKLLAAIAEITESEPDARQSFFWRRSCAASPKPRAGGWSGTSNMSRPTR